MCEKMAERMFGLYLVMKRGMKNPIRQHFCLMVTEEETISREKNKPVCCDCDRSIPVTPQISL